MALDFETKRRTPPLPLDALGFPPAIDLRDLPLPTSPVQIEQPEPAETHRFRDHMAHLGHAVLSHVRVPYLPWQERPYVYHPIKGERGAYESKPIRWHRIGTSRAA